MSQIFFMLPWNMNLGFWGTIFYVLLVIGLWKVFEKAHEQGWKAIIPVYNFYILFKISGIPAMFWIWLICTGLSGAAYWLSGVIFLFYPVAWLLSLIAAALQFAMWYQLSMAFGHGLLFALGLWIFNPVFLMILGYSSSWYRRYA